MAPRADSAADVRRLAAAVTPHALLLDGMPLDSNDAAVVACAELLHDREIDDGASQRDTNGKSIVRSIVMGQSTATAADLFIVAD